MSTLHPYPIIITFNIKKELHLKPQAEFRKFLTKASL